jgi:hypothetical protein
MNNSVAATGWWPAQPPRTTNAVLGSANEVTPFPAGACGQVVSLRSSRQPAVKSSAAIQHMTVPATPVSRELGDGQPGRAATESAVPWPTGGIDEPGRTRQKQHVRASLTELTVSIVRLCD